MKREEKVAIFDLDPQMTSLNQFDKRTQQGLDGEPMTIAATLNRLPQLLRAAKNEGKGPHYLRHATKYWTRKFPYL